MPGLKHVALLFGLVTAAGTTSWQQPVEPPVLSIKTVLVSLTVTVVDQNGALVPGLRQRDFTVFDNGQPQDVVAAGHRDSFFRLLAQGVQRVRYELSVSEDRATDDCESTSRSLSEPVQPRRMFSLERSNGAWLIRSIELREASTPRSDRQ